MDQTLVGVFLERGLLGAIVVVQSIVIVRLYNARENLWKCIFKLQTERLADSKEQLEIVNSLREMFESALKVLRAARG